MTIPTLLKNYQFLDNFHLEGLFLMLNGILHSERQPRSH